MGNSSGRLVDSEYDVEGEVADIRGEMIPFLRLFGSGKAERPLPPCGNSDRWFLRPSEQTAKPSTPQI
jgi:hypothetical protein